MRVRRFQKQLDPREFSRLAEFKYQNFKYSTLFPEIQPLMRPGLWEKECWNIAEQLRLKESEVNLLAKLCECSEKSPRPMPVDPSIQVKQRSFHG